MANNDQIIYDIAIKNGYSPLVAKFIVSQARFESGNYTSQVFRLNTNTSGMKYVGQPLATRGTLAPPSERSASCRSGGVCINSDHYAKFNSVSDSAKDKIERLYRLTMRGVTTADLKNAKTPEEFARLQKKRGYYGKFAYGTAGAEAEIRNYGAGMKTTMKNLDIVETATNNKNGILIGIVSIIAAIFLLKRKK
jgi:hypothetical protein